MSTIIQKTMGLLPFKHGWSFMFSFLLIGRGGDHLYRTSDFAMLRQVLNDVNVFLQILCKNDVCMCIFFQSIIRKSLIFKNANFMAPSPMQLAKRFKNLFSNLLQNLFDISLYGSYLYCQYYLLHLNLSCESNLSYLLIKNIVENLIFFQFYVFNLFCNFFLLLQ